MKESSEHVSLTATSTSAERTVTMTGEGDFRNKPTLGSMTMSIAGPQQLSVQSVLKDTTIYISSDLFRGQLPHGKIWMSMDMAKVAKTIGVSMPSGWSSQTPADTLAMLRATGSQVTKIGPDTVDGLATTHYTATVDPARAAKVGKALGMTVSYAPVDVWVDAQGLVRRLHLSYTASGSSTLPDSSMELTETLSRYGEPVNVTVPPSWQTYDATKAATDSLNP